MPKKILLIGILLVQSACAISMMADYDAATDKALIGLQKRVDLLCFTLKETLNSGRADYKNYASTYRTLDTELNVILTRSRAMPKNDLSVRQLELLQKSLADFKMLHQMGFHHLSEIDVAQQSLDQSFQSIYSLELAKKDF